MKDREFKSVHDRHCCPNHGCKYGDEDCPVESGHEEGIPCEYCYEVEQKIKRAVPSARDILEKYRVNSAATSKNQEDLDKKLLEELNSVLSDAEWS